ncbi:MAG: hypothetical protein A2Y14_01930 [Verrucomicrobia bacterium GWF2_51_19]|nr:MAG: hypothetical protein A2Y14_01930 [Verrucomicrobia bacterium GWF2_51_19]HCJ11860.1 carbohydrate kinase [Opitutae bacterium]
MLKHIAFWIQTRFILTLVKTLLEDIQKLHILVIGDVMLDHYIWGDAHRISPEAPVPVVHIERDSYTAGAAANVALNIASLCARATLLGPIGNDAPGQELSAILRRAHVDLLPVGSPDNIATIQKTRVVVRNQQLCRLDREASPHSYNCDSRLDIKPVLKLLENVDAVIISDYAKGFVTESLIQSIQTAAKACHCLIALDPKPKRKLRFRGVDILTPNRSEAYQLADIEEDPHSPFPADLICSKIFEKYAPDKLVITMGADGMLISEQGKASHAIPTYAREVFDVSGAGDTSVAALTLALAAKADIYKAAHFANTAAGIVVSKVGTATTTPAEMLLF